ncbi:MAG TPA: transporter substrate-binding domain-containing protein [Pseudonocardiaceae bacterium]|nr:transporter substrate-binding domain-containing protein [Pseudonocardiaceae bacterium]
MTRQYLRRSPVCLLITALLVIFAFATACGSSAKSNVLAAAKQRGSLRVALTGTNPPWSLVDENNESAGFDADIARALATRMGVARVDFVQSNFQNFIPGIQNGKFDLVVSGQTMTKERANQVAFSTPYEVNGVSIFVRQGNNSIAKRDDLAGKRIAVSAGSTQEQLARTIPDAQVLIYDNATLALTDVARDRADAWLGSRFVGAYLAQKNRLSIKDVPGYLSLEINAITARLGQQQLIDAVNTGLSSMISDGTFTAISKKWLGGLDMAAEINNLPADKKVP